jgi:hypothetical protein
MSFLKGKPAESKNQAYPWLTQQFSAPAQALTSQGQAGLGNYMAMLNGSDGGAGFNTYKQSTGYENIFDEAMRGVTSNAASKGLLASGSTLRATQDRAGQLAQQNFQNYLAQVLEGSKTGLAGGQNLASLITQGGETSKGAQKGLLDYLAQAGEAAGKAAAAGSDRRLKDDIVLLDREPDGLGIYSFRYKWEDEPTVGVMADEVAELRPHALGPVIQGFATVRYGLL